MGEIIRFVCPDCEKSQTERINECIDNISKWVNSDALYKMVSIFGQSIPDFPLKDKIDWLNEFANEWDYRKKQAREGERGNVQEDPIARASGDKILECVKCLGLENIESPILLPDYILPLGGARLSNYARPLKARELIDINGIQGKTVIALSGTRPINEVERPFMESFAPNAVTEFDAISKGLEKAFSLSENKINEEYCKNDNINLEWAQRTYIEKYHDNAIISLAAPSSDPDRRANSRDTFEFFLNKFHITNGDRVLLVTSCIYVPFQLLRFMDLAIEKGFYVDCVGMPNDDRKGTAFNYISNYCQETKATINAIKALSDKWL